MIAILTVSDTRTPETDKSGPATQAALEVLGYTDFKKGIVKDNQDEIERELKHLAAHCEAVFTTGGTGFALRDVTPEATANVIARRADNLSELMRLKGLEHTDKSHLSRGMAGILGTCLIVNLPGSPKGAQQGIEALAPLLPAILAALKGEACPEH